MHSHFLYMFVFAAGVGAVLGAMLRSDVREAFRLAVVITLGLLGTALAIAWLMYLLAG